MHQRLTASSTCAAAGLYALARSSPRASMALTNTTCMRRRSVSEGYFPLGFGRGAGTSSRWLRAPDPTVLFTGGFVSSEGPWPVGELSPGRANGLVPSSSVEELDAGFGF